MKAIATAGPVWALVLALLVGFAAGDAASAATPRYTLAWTQRTDVGSPGPRYGHALAYDSDRGILVFFGGEYSLPGGDPEYFNDTWEYDGVSWKQIVIEGPVPEPRSRHAMCYDNVLKRVILLGGLGGLFEEVWNYESSGPQRGRWTRRAILNAGPGPLAGHTMIFDYFAGRAIVAGGNPLNLEDSQSKSTWEWDNSLGLWSLRPQSIGFHASGLGAGLTDHMMLYDYRRRETVVVGGIGPFGTKLTASHRIYIISGARAGGYSCGSPVLEGSIVYDGFHDIYVDCGGNDYGVSGDVSELATPNIPSIWYPALEGFACSYDPDDVSVRFADAEPVVRPGPRAQTAMIYDEKRRITVLFGGVGGTRYGDTWELVTQDSWEVWVQFSHQGIELGTFEFPYRTLAQGIAHVVAGGTLKIKSGSTSETPHLTRQMILEAFGGQVSIGHP